jgi:hypothetical protein
VRREKQFFENLVKREHHKEAQGGLRVVRVKKCCPSCTLLLGYVHGQLE